MWKWSIYVVTLLHHKIKRNIFCRREKVSVNNGQLLVLVATLQRHFACLPSLYSCLACLHIYLLLTCPPGLGCAAVTEQKQDWTRIGKPGPIFNKIITEKKKECGSLMFRSKKIIVMNQLVWLLIKLHAKFQPSRAPSPPCPSRKLRGCS